MLIDRAYKEKSNNYFYIDKVENLESDDRIGYFKLKKYNREGELKKTKTFERGVSK